MLNFCATVIRESWETACIHDFSKEAEHSGQVLCPKFLKCFSKQASTYHQRQLLTLVFFEQAERSWQALSPKIPTHVFRLAGIYGPGRSALDTVRKLSGDKGRVRAASAGPGESKWVSRVHVRDICECVMASMERPSSLGCVYNVADDEPEKRDTVMRYARELLGTPDEDFPLGAFPRGDQAVSERRARSDNKRVSNARCELVTRSLVLPETLQRQICHKSAIFQDVFSSDKGHERHEEVSMIRCNSLSSIKSFWPVIFERSLMQVKNARAHAHMQTHTYRLMFTFCRIKDELGVTLRYPTYREGLRAIHAGSTDPFVTS